VPTFRALLAALVLATGLAAPATGAAAPFTVDSTGDASDAAINGTCATSGAVCTLRAALDEANATAAADTITFGPLFDGSIAATISVADGEAVDQPVTIDGGDCGTAGHPKPCAGIEGAGAHRGITVTTPGAVTIRGMAITGTIIGVSAETGTSSGLVVRGNWFGRRLDGSLGSNNQGVTVDATTSGVTVGGPAPGDRNLFQDNDTGVRLAGSANLVAGNDFGVGPTGSAGGGNDLAVSLDSNSGFAVPDGNVIGGTDGGTPQVCDGPCNLFAGGVHAIEMQDFATGEVDNTTIAGNYIGIDPAGTRDYSVLGTAILNHQADGTVVGGATAAHRNYVGASGPTGTTSANGITAEDGAQGLVIRNNFLGVAATGTTAVPDAAHAIEAMLTDPMTIADNRFGATATRPASYAVRVHDEATMTGNTFGLGTGGQAFTGPANAPWILADGSDNVIGGTTLADENVLSNSGAAAIQVEDTGTAALHNRILRNRGAGNAGPFIDLVPDAGPGNSATGPNDGIQRMSVGSAATTSVLSGADARAGATIRVFEVGDTLGTVVGFAGSVVDADGGGWNVTLTGVSPGDCLAATQTDASGNSSELSLVAVAGGGECTAAAPAEPAIGTGPQDDALTSDPTPTWTFTTNKFATFECRVFLTAGAPPAFGACSGPSGPAGSHTAAPLADGAYTFEVRPRDTANQIGSSHTAGFVLDTVKPLVTILSPAEGSVTGGSPTFSFSAGDDAEVRRCGFDNAGLVPCTTASSHTPAEPLGEGAHTFHVRVADAAGNEATADRAFTIPGPAPVADPPAAQPPGSGPPQGPPAPAPTADRVAPVVSGLRLAARRAAVRLSLSEAASVAVVVERRTTGRRARFRRIAAFTRQGKAGANRLALPRALARRLRAGGVYRLSVVATDAAGNASRRARLAVK
jgi:hypothetical protein